MSGEHRLTDLFVIRPTPAYATAAVGRYSLVAAMPSFAVDAGTLADVAALGGALVEFAGGVTVPLTVGSAFPFAHVAEYQTPERPGHWLQAKPGGLCRFWRPTALRGPSWSMWTTMPDSDRALPCRLVRVEDMDADPASRGGL